MYHSIGDLKTRILFSRYIETR